MTSNKYLGHHIADGFAGELKIHKGQKRSSLDLEVNAHSMSTYQNEMGRILKSAGFHPKIKKVLGGFKFSEKSDGFEYSIKSHIGITGYEQTDFRIRTKERDENLPDSTRLIGAIADYVRFSQFVEQYD